MAFATLWIGQDDTVSHRECGGNIRLELGAAVVWMTPEQWERLTKPARPALKAVGDGEDLTLTDLRIPRLQPVTTPIRKLTAPEFGRGEPPEAA